MWPQPLALIMQNEPHMPNPGYSDGPLGPIARLFASLPPQSRRQFYAGVLALVQAIPPERRVATIRWVFKNLTTKVSTSWCGYCTAREVPKVVRGRSRSKGAELTVAELVPRDLL